MRKLRVERCPETGIGSIVKEGAGKVDLMPDEVLAIQQMGDNTEEIRAVIAESNRSFAESLTAEELAEIAAGLR